MNFEEILKKLSTKCVGIAGCGGLGSNCAVALARTGVGKLVLVDFDTVDKTNLNRQYYFADQIGMKKVDALSENLFRVRKDLEIEKHDTKLDPVSIRSVFSDCDLIVEAFDLAEMKYMIIETVICDLPEIPLVVGNGMAGWGRSNELKTEKAADHLYICGDQTSDIMDGLPPLAPRVGIVSMMQANTALNILLETENNLEL